MNALAIDPVSPATLYAGTDNGIHKTVNGGQSWDSLSYTTSVRVIRIDPTAPDTVYAGTPGSGVYKSVGGGLNWVASNEGLPGGDRAIFGLAIDPTNPATLYMGTFSGKVYVSNDGAATWHLPGEPINSTVSHSQTNSSDWS